MSLDRLCAEHPNVPAIAACERCGGFVCEACGKQRGSESGRWCPACAALLERQEAWELQLRSLARTLALGHVLLGVLVLATPVAAGLRMQAQGEPFPMSLLLWGVMMGGPQLLCGALVAWLRQPWPSWAGVLGSMCFCGSLGVTGATGPVRMMIGLCAVLVLFVLVRGVQLWRHRRALPERHSAAAAAR